MAPDPFRVLAHSYAAGDDRLSALLLQHLFPWTRLPARPTLAPAAARRTLATLTRHLGI